MPLNEPMEGNGVTITFGTSAWAAEITNLSWAGIERASLEKSHLGTGDWKEYGPAKLSDPGTLDIEFFFDPANQPPTKGDPEQITIEFPKVDENATNGARFRGTGFVQKYDPFGAKNDEYDMSKATIKWSGEVEYLEEA